MTDYDYLLHIVSCALSGAVPDLPTSDVSLEKVLEYGRLHEVANVAYLSVKKLGDNFPAAFSDAFRQEYWKAVTRDNAQRRAHSAILEALHSRGIYTLEVQGTIVKSYYPERHLRMMSDMDFIIPFDKLSEAKTALEELGYSCEITHDGTEINANLDQLNIELHTDFFDKKQSVSEFLNNAFSYASLNSDFTATVSDEVFYLFHLLHTIKHATEFMGVGIRRIVDLYYLEHVMASVSDFALDTIRKAGLYDVYESLISVKNHWFSGADLPDSLLDFEQEILASGNHGTNEIFYKNKFRKDEKNGKNFVKFRYFLHFIFPSKDELYYAYPKLALKKVPLIFCWPYRWFVSFFSKKNKAAKIKSVFSNLKVKFK